MIDLQEERIIPLKDVSKHVPSKPCKATIDRWWSKGVRGVKLETCCVGAKRFTSVEAIGRFIDELNGYGPYYED